MKRHSFLEKLGYPIENAAVGDEAIYGVAWLAGQAHRTVAQTLKRFGLTPVKFNILMVVKHIGRSEGLSQQAIGKRLVIKKSNMTPLLKELERQGWIVRNQDVDRRFRRILVTIKGSKLLDSVWPVYKETLKQLTAGFSQANQSRLVDLLSRWHDALQG